MMSFRARSYSMQKQVIAGEREVPVERFFLWECIIEIVRSHFSAVSLYNRMRSICRKSYTSNNCSRFLHCCYKLTIPETNASVHDGIMYVFFHFWQRTRMKTTPTREWRWSGSSSVNTAANCASLAPNSRATCPSPTPVSTTMHVHSVAD